MGRLLVVIHNVYSVTRLIEAAKMVYGFNINDFVVSRAIGAAAQEGVPEVSKLALKKGRNVIFLKDIDDLLDSIKLGAIFLFVPKQYAKQKFDPYEVLKLLEEHNVALIFGGAEPGLSKRDLEKGTPVYIDVPEDIGTLGTMAIALYNVYLASLRGHMG